MKNKFYLIELFCSICRHYDTTLKHIVQRFSNNNSPKFSDTECITICIFWMKCGVLQLNEIHNLTKEFFSDWFPALPSYQKFVKRVQYLAPAFEYLVVLLSQEKFQYEKINYVLDSMPIVVAKGCRSQKAKVANDICDKGYCGSKKIFYYGVKLHCIAIKRFKTLPKPQNVWVTKASENDITTAKEMITCAENADIYADKAYANASWNKQLSLNNVRVITPIKLKKGQKEHGFFTKLYNKMVSSARQAIEQFFSWIQLKTKIHNASLVRSSAGLLSFIFLRIASVLI